MMQTLQKLSSRPQSEQGVEEKGKSSARTTSRVLVLYDMYSTFTSTVQEYLDSFQQYSHHDVWFVSATKNNPCTIDLNWFDVVVIHYSVRLCYEQYISPEFSDALKLFDGLKVLYIQDEYDNTHQAQAWIRDLGIQVVYTVVPEPYVAVVYPPQDFPGTTFYSTLTGFVPERLEDLKTTTPMAQRPVWIGYRGRDLPYWYGDLGQEKIAIGRGMKPFCQAQGIPCDIEWEADKRIYGQGWYDFMQQCRAMLGSESGANLFDMDGSLRKTIETALKTNPGLTYEEARQQWLAPYEAQITQHGITQPVMMNQISPKLFEAIASRTALILFEGTYSGVLQPHLHYMPLKKDFSNVDEIFKHLEDVPYLESLTQRAYQDVVESGLYSYRAFIENLEACIERHRNPNRPLASNRYPLIYAVVGVQTQAEHPEKTAFIDPAVDLRTVMPLDTLIYYKRQPAKPKPKRNLVQKIGLEIKRLIKRVVRPLYEWTCDS